MAFTPVGDSQKGLDEIIALLGSDGQYTIAKTRVTTTVRGAISPMSKDVDLVQAYGVNGMRITFKSGSFAQRPSKFDWWIANGQRFVFDTVTDIIVAGTLIGYTCWTKGTVS